MKRKNNEREREGERKENHHMHRYISLYVENCVQMKMNNSRRF